MIESPYVKIGNKAHGDNGHFCASFDNNGDIDFNMAMTVDQREELKDLLDELIDEFEE